MVNKELATLYPDCRILVCCQYILMVGVLIGIKLYENSVVLEYYIMPAKLIHNQISIFRKSTCG